jgi:hypothetical protein
MSRLGSLCWLLLVAATGFATYKVKYAVQEIEEQLARVRKQIVVEQQEIHVLNAEWTALNQPDRLAELNRRFLSLSAIGAKQLQHSIDEIPLRSPAAAMPDRLIAAFAETLRPAVAPGAVAATATIAAPAAAPAPAPVRTAPAKAAPQLAAAPTQLPRSLDQLIDTITGSR